MDIGTLTGKIELQDQMSAVLTKVNDLLGKFGQSTTEQMQKAQNFGSTLSSVGKAMSIGITAPIVAFGTAAIAAGLAMEGAYNTIARKTGETGTALQGLKGDFETVFTTVPNSAQEVATAIADVHQRLGLVGEELQTVTKKFIDFANVNQVDVATATKTVSTLMGALSEDTKLSAKEIGEASSIMDKLTYASQISGASVTKLAEGVVKGGVAFVEMGFSLNESLALFAQFEKVGANITDVTSSLQRTMANLAKEGVTDLAGAFKGLVEEIRLAPTYAAASILSVKAFGSIAGPRLTEEIRGGTYSVGELSSTIANLGNVTQDTASQSESFVETLGTLRNKITAALGPVGIELLISFRALIPAISDVVKILAAGIKWFSELPKSVQLSVFALVGLVAAIGPVLLGVASLIVTWNALPAALTGAIASFVSSRLAIFALNSMLSTAALGVAAFGSVLAAFVAGYAFGTWLEKNTEWAREFSDAFEYASLRLQGFSAAEADVKIATDHVTEAAKRQLAIEKERAALGPAKAKSAVAPEDDLGKSAAEREAAQTDRLNEALQRLTKDAYTPLTDAQLRYTIAADAAGDSVEKIIKVTKASERATRLAVESLKVDVQNTEKELKASATAWKEWAAAQDAAGKHAMEVVTEYARSLQILDIELEALRIAEKQSAREKALAAIVTEGEARKKTIAMEIEAERKKALELGSLLDVGVDLYEAQAAKINEITKMKIEQFKENETGMLEFSQITYDNLAKDAQTKFEEVADSKEIPELIQHFQDIRDKAVKAADDFRSGFKSALDDTVGNAQNAVKGINAAFNSMIALPGINERANWRGTQGYGPPSSMKMASVLFGDFGTPAVAPQAAGSNTMLNGIPLPVTGKASGGPVTAGQRYRVGELGAETFVPQQSGTIVPAGGGGGTTVILNAPNGFWGADRNQVARALEDILSQRQTATAQYSRR